MFRHTVCFYGKDLLLPRPTPKLEHHPLSAVCDFLFNTFAATVHIWRPNHCIISLHTFSDALRCWFRHAHLFIPGCISILGIRKHGH